jgi:hypothetical protein
MKYMLLIHQGSTPAPEHDEAWRRLSQSEQTAVVADYQAIDQTAGVTTGLRLHAPAMATTVRVKESATLTADGPYAEIDGALAGYLFFEGEDLDAAIELAARVPAARMGGAVEIRPVAEW